MGFGGAKLKDRPGQVTLAAWGPRGHLCGPRRVSGIFIQSRFNSFSLFFGVWKFSTSEWTSSVRKNV